MGRVVALVLAAGEGERIGLGPKAFLSVGGRCILDMAARAAADCPAVDALVIVVPSAFEDRARDVVHVSKPLAVVAGGRTRQESVRLALVAAGDDAEHVVCHDAARPFAAPEIFSSVLAALAEADGVVPVLPLPDTVKRVHEGWVEETVPRDDLRIAQTPQGFVAKALREAHRRAAEARRTFTDDAAMLEWAGYRVRTVAGEPVNFKITTPADLARAEAFVLEQPSGAARSTHG